MTIAQQIAQILEVSSTDVVVTNEKEARLKDRELTESEQEQIEHVFYSDEKKELNALKEENKRLKAELKLQRDRIAEATDFADLKAKITKAKDSEDKPTKWSDKEVFLEGERIEHKGDHFYTRSDHTASKDAEPQDTPDLYRPIPNT